MRVVKVLLGLVILLGCFSAPMAQAQTASETAAEQKASESKPAYTLPPEKLARAIEYSRKRVVLGFVETGWGILQLLLLLVLGVAGWVLGVRRGGGMGR